MCAILDSMKRMTDEFIKQIRSRMGYSGMNISQVELAKRLEVSKNYMNRVLNGHDGRMPDIWEGILKELDMTVMPIPNNKISDVKRALVD